MYYTAKILASAFIAGAWSGLPGFAAEQPHYPLSAEGQPALLYEKPLPKPREQPESNATDIEVQTRNQAGTAPAREETARTQSETWGGHKKERRYAPFRDHRQLPERRATQQSEPQQAEPEWRYSEIPEDNESIKPPIDPAAVPLATEDSDKYLENPPALQLQSDSIESTLSVQVDEQSVATPALAEDPACQESAPQPESPTPEAVEQYRIKLENRLLERYNNLPESAGKVGKVVVVLSRPLEVSIDGKLIKAEFDQLVYDIWGKRMPALEKEYYVVTFGSYGVEQVRSDPSIRIGLDMEKTFPNTSLCQPTHSNMSARTIRAPTNRRQPCPAGGVRNFPNCARVCGHESIGRFFVVFVLCFARLFRQYAQYCLQKPDSPRTKTTKNRSKALVSTHSKHWLEMNGEHFSRDFSE